MPDINPQTGEPQNAAGWSQDDPSQASTTFNDRFAGAKALSSALSRQSEQYGGKMEALTSDMEKTYKQQQEAEAPIRKDLMTELSKPAAAHAHLEKVAQAPKPEDYQKYSMEFASAMALIGAISGRWTRNAGNASLNAFAGALKGWKEGNAEAYANAAKEWEQNTKKTIENNQMELEKYHEILNDKKNTVDMMLAKLNVVSTEFQNKIVFDATVAKNLTLATTTIDKSDTVQAKLELAYEKQKGLMSYQADQIKGKVEEYNKDPQLAAGMSAKDWANFAGTVKAMRKVDPSIPELKPRSEGGLPAGWTKEQMDFNTDMFLRTGQMPGGFGMGNVKTAIMQNAAARAQALGMTAGDVISGRADVKALTSTLGVLEKQKAAVDVFENTAKRNGEVLIALADKVDQTGVPVIERWERAGRRNIEGDADVNNFNAQVRLYANEVAKVITNPNLTGVLTDTARREAESFVGGDISAQMVRRLIPLLNGDMDRRQQSMADEIQVVKGLLGGSPQQQGAQAPANASSPDQSDPLGIR